MHDCPEALAASRLAAARTRRTRHGLGTPKDGGQCLPGSVNVPESTGPASIDPSTAVSDDGGQIYEPTHIVKARESLRHADDRLRLTGPACPTGLIRNALSSKRRLDALLALWKRKATEAHEACAHLANFLPDESHVSRSVWAACCAVALVIDAVGAFWIANGSLVPGNYLGYVTAALTGLPLIIGGFTGLSLRKSRETVRGTGAWLTWVFLFCVGVVAAIAYVLAGILARFEVAIATIILGKTIATAPAVIMTVTALIGLCLGFAAENRVEPWSETLANAKIASKKRQVEDVEDKVMAETARLDATVDELHFYTRPETVREDLFVARVQPSAKGAGTP